MSRTFVYVLEKISECWSIFVPGTERVRLSTEILDNLFYLSLRQCLACKSCRQFSPFSPQMIDMISGARYQAKPYSDAFPLTH